MHFSSRYYFQRGMKKIDLHSLDSEQRFFSFTSTPSEVSLILSEEHLDLFSKELFDIDSTCWKAIQVGSGATGTCKLYCKFNNRKLEEM